jgi:hypothetical protein
MIAPGRVGHSTLTRKDAMKTFVTLCGLLLATIAPAYAAEPALQYMDGGLWHVWSDLVVFQVDGRDTFDVTLDLTPGADGLPLIGLYNPYPTLDPPSVIDGEVTWVLHHYNEAVGPCGKAQVHVKVSDRVNRYNSLFVFMKVADSGRRCP